MASATLRASPRSPRVAGDSAPKPVSEMRPAAVMPAVWSEAPMRCISNWALSPGSCAQSSGRPGTLTSVRISLPPAVRAAAMKPSREASPVAESITGRDGRASVQEMLEPFSDSRSMARLACAPVAKVSWKGPARSPPFRVLVKVANLVASDGLKSLPTGAPTSVSPFSRTRSLAAPAANTIVPFASTSNRKSALVKAKPRKRAGLDMRGAGLCAP